ncbi:hypothetical protein PS6_011883, partial [Mucor atramentarius]
MIKFCPEGESKKTADYLKKQKVHHHQPKESMDITKAHQLTMDVMDSKKDEDEDENLDSNVDEEDSLQGDDTDESENEESGDQEILDEEMSLLEENHQVKEKEDDLMEDDEVVLAGGASRSLVKSSAYSKYAPNSVSMTMQVDKREEMLGMTSLRQETQRKRQAFDVKLKQASGSYGSSKGGVKTGSKAVGQGSGGA